MVAPTSVGNYQQTFSITTFILPRFAKKNIYWLASGIVCFFLFPIRGGAHSCPTASECSGKAKHPCFGIAHLHVDIADPSSRFMGYAEFSIFLNQQVLASMPNCIHIGYKQRKVISVPIHQVIFNAYPAVSIPRAGTLILKGYHDLVILVNASPTR